MAMPLMAGVKTICTHVPDWKPWANLLDAREHTEEHHSRIEEDLLGETLDPEQNQHVRLDWEERKERVTERQD